MESRAKLLGHSVHAMLITFPIGLFVTAALFDAVHTVTGRGPWAIVSYWLIIAGIVGGLCAAIFGYIDYRGIPTTTRAHHVGRLHGVGNVIVVVLFAISAWIRHDALLASTPWAYVFSYLGTGLAAVTAWLGGELVERLGVGVSDGAHLDAPSSLTGPSVRSP